MFFDIGRCNSPASVRALGRTVNPPGEPDRNQRIVDIHCLNASDVSTARLQSCDGGAVVSSFAVTCNGRYDRWLKQECLRKIRTVDCTPEQVCLGFNRRLVSPAIPAVGTMEWEKMMRQQMSGPRSCSVFASGVRF
jgi:hypothetical protein